MVLYNKLTRDTWAVGDFDSGSHNLTGTIYSDDDLGTPFDLTGYTLEIILYDTVLDQIHKDGLDGTIVTAASGTWKLVVADGDLSNEFQGEVIVKLTKSGTELTAVDSGGSSRLVIYPAK